MTMTLDQGNLYRVTYIKKGYECQEFVYKEDLIDTLSNFAESAISVIGIVVEDD